MRAFNRECPLFEVVVNGRLPLASATETKRRPIDRIYHRSAPVGWGVRSIDGARNDEMRRCVNRAVIESLP